MRQPAASGGNSLWTSFQADPLCTKIRLVTVLVPVEIVAANTLPAGQRDCVRVHEALWDELNLPGPPNLESLRVWVGAFLCPYLSASHRLYQPAGISTASLLLTGAGDVFGFSRIVSNY